MSAAIDRSAVAEVCRDHRIELLVLYGSHSAGRGTPKSDVDLGFLRSGERISLDERQTVAVRLQPLLGPGDLDFVDLARVPGLLKHLAAERGKLLHEARPGLFEAFRVRAWNQYQDERLSIRCHDREGIRIALARITS